MHPDKYESSGSEIDGDLNENMEDSDHSDFQDEIVNLEGEDEDSDEVDIPSTSTKKRKKGANTFVQSSILRFGITTITNNQNGNGNVESQSQDELNVSNGTLSNNSNPESETAVEASKKNGATLTILNGDIFEIVTEDAKTDLVKAKCLLCAPKTHYICGSKSSSSNYFRHLKKVHMQNEAMWKLYDQSKVNRRKKDDKKMNSGSDPWKATLSTSATVNTAITNFITHGMHAFSMVDEPKFKEMFPGKKVMSAKTLVSRVSNAKIEMVEKITKRLESAPYICLTTDIWSAKTRSFLGVTAHIIDDQLKRENYALACKRFKGEHNNVAIAEMLTDICGTYHIPIEKVVATITDNGSNFLKAFRDFGIYSNVTTVTESDVGEGCENVSDDYKFENSEVITSIQTAFSLSKHISCGSHSLNLIATADFDKILNEQHKDNIALKKIHDNFMKKANILWFGMKRSKSAEYIKDTLGKSLKYPVKTRWNSLFDAVRDLQEQEKNVLNTILTKLSKEKVAPQFTNVDIQYMKTFANVMTQIGLSLDALQTEDDSDITGYGMFLPAIHTICLHLQNIKLKSTVKEERLLASGLYNAMCDRFPKFIDLEIFMSDEDVKFAMMATLSHPQFKNNWSSVYEISEIEAQAILMEACDSCPIPDTYSHDATDNVEGKPPKKTCFSYKPKVPSVDKLKNEVTLYLHSSDENIEMLNNFPHVKAVFLKYNTALSSSAPVERLFNHATILDKSLRHNLSDTNFENCVTLKGNAKKKNNVVHL